MHHINSSMKMNFLFFQLINHHLYCLLSRNPTPFQPKKSHFTWLRMKGEFTQYLQISDVTIMVRSPLLHKRMAFWDNLYNFVFSNHENTTAPPYILSTGFCLLLLVCVVIFAIAFEKNYIRRRDYIRWK